MSATSAPPLRLGFAGLGVGAGMFLRSIEHYPHVEVVAAAEVRPGALETFAQRYGGRTYDSVEALCADPGVDVVWIATPNHLHREHTLLAAANRKHIICTKPMALTVEECAAMCAAAERNGVALLCGQTYSMSSDVQAMAQVAASGRLGRVISVTTVMSMDWLLKPRVPEELDESLGGGVLYRHGPHLVDTARVLAGSRLRSVRGSVGRWMPERPCVGNFSAFLAFEDGTPATIVYNGYGYFDTSELTWGIGNRMYSDAERIAVRRELRSGTADGAGGKEAMRFGAPGEAPPLDDPNDVNTISPWFGLTVVSCERGDIRQSPHGIFVYDDDGRHEIEVKLESIGLPDVKELYEHLSTGKPLTHDGRWALATLEACTAILRSSDEGREIVLEHQGTEAASIGGWHAV